MDDNGNALTVEHNKDVGYFKQQLPLAKQFTLERFTEYWEVILQQARANPDSDDVKTALEKLYLSEMDWTIVSDANLRRTIAVTYFRFVNTVLQNYGRHVIELQLESWHQISEMWYVEDIYKLKLDMFQNLKTWCPSLKALRWRENGLPNDISFEVKTDLQDCITKAQSMDLEYFDISFYHHFSKSVLVARKLLFHYESSLVELNVAAEAFSNASHYPTLSFKSLTVLRLSNYGYDSRMTALDWSELYSRLFPRMTFLGLSLVYAAFMKDLPTLVNGLGTSTGLAEFELDQSFQSLTVTPSSPHPKIRHLKRLYIDAFSTSDVNLKILQLVEHADEVIILNWKKTFLCNETAAYNVKLFIPTCPTLYFQRAEDYDNDDDENDNAEEEESWFQYDMTRVPSITDI